MAVDVCPIVRDEEEAEWIRASGGSDTSLHIVIFVDEETLRNVKFSLLDQLDMLEEGLEGSLCGSGLLELSEEILEDDKHGGVGCEVCRVAVTQPDRKEVEGGREALDILKEEGLTDETLHMLQQRLRLLVQRMRHRQRPHPCPS